MVRLLQSSDVAMMTASFETYAILQMSSASVSLVASSAMAIMILRTEKRLSTPYRRIIFGMSITGILSSFVTVAAPFFVPSNIPSSWGVGNEGTCKMVGFMLIWGVNMVPMYTCFLCWYYLCKLKYHMTNDAFGHKFEWKGHIVIILVSLSLAMTALLLDTIHTTAFRTTCQLAVAPLGCRIIPEVVGGCDATIETRANAVTVVIHGLRILWLFGMIAIMSMLYHHVVTTNRIFSSSPLMSNRANNTQYVREGCSSREFDRSGGSDESIRSTADDENPNDSGALHQQAAIQTRAQENLNDISALYRSEIALQGTCYVVAYCLTHLPIIALYGITMCGRIPPKSLLLLAFTLTPLGGLFIILVYTRPQIAHLRRISPELSRIKCFWLVMKAGGEVPEEPSDHDDYSYSHIPSRNNLRARRLRLRQRQQPGEESISSIQFGLASEMSQIALINLSPLKVVSEIHSQNKPPQISEGETVKLNPKDDEANIDGERMCPVAEVKEKYIANTNPKHKWKYTNGKISKEIVRDTSDVSIDYICYQGLGSNFEASSLDGPAENSEAPEASSTVGHHVQFTPNSCPKNDSARKEDCVGHRESDYYESISGLSSSYSSVGEHNIQRRSRFLSSPNKLPL